MTEQQKTLVRMIGASAVVLTLSLASTPDAVSADGEGGACYSCPNGWGCVIDHTGNYAKYCIDENPGCTRWGQCWC